MWYFTIFVCVTYDLLSLIMKHGKGGLVTEVKFDISMTEKETGVYWEIELGIYRVIHCFTSEQKCSVQKL